ncbi:MAG TPA: hypothetical protein DCZ04_02290 [Syntrophorhabdus aromaticivorans]|nr:hypothetical protein [Syntrophorhabdus aromaticivorans]
MPAMQVKVLECSARTAKADRQKNEQMRKQKPDGRSRCLALDDCTKEELLCLVKNRLVLHITERDISMARWETMRKKADDLYRKGAGDE